VTLNPRASRFGSASSPHDANGIYRAKITLVYDDSRLRVFINKLGISVGPLRVSDRASASQFQVNDEVLVSYLDNQMSEMIVIGRLTEREGGFSPEIVDALNGELLEYDGTNWTNAVRPSGEPIGFEDRNTSAISFDNSTRTFTIQPTGASFNVWCSGVRYVKTAAATTVIPNTTGLYYIKYNSLGVLGYKTTYFTWDEETPVSYVYWNADTSSAEFFADERHGVALDWATHEYLHRTRGAAIASGFGAYGYTLAAGGDSDSDAQISIADGTFFDEDLEVEITHAGSPAANTWEQKLQSPAYVPVMYRDGTAWVLDTATEFPLKYGTSRATYNAYSLGSWSASDLDSGKFGSTWIVATNNLNEPIIGILGQGQDDNIGQAEEREWADLDLDGLPIFELRPLYKIIYETNDTYTNTVKSDIVGVYDIRSTDGSQIVVASSPLSSLTDVSLTTPTTDDVLVYNGNHWTNSDDVSVATLSVGGAGISTTGASSGDVLAFDGSDFVPTAASGGSSIPSGSIMQWAGTSASPPTGWLFCNGDAVNRTTEASLFAAIGDQYGVGDGSTTFNLPNISGKVVVGYDSGDTDFNTLGNTDGSKSVGLTAANIAQHVHGQPHNHSLNSHTHTYPHSHNHPHSHPVSIPPDGGHSHTRTVYQGFAPYPPGSVLPPSNSYTGAYTLGMRAVATTVGTSGSNNPTGAHTHPGASTGAASPSSTGIHSPTSTGGPSQPNSGTASPAWTDSGYQPNQSTALGSTGTTFSVMPPYIVLRYIIKT
jgi:microcystin-dependent protein